MKTAVTSSAAPSALRRFADRVITLPPHPALPSPVATHADMIFCAVDKKVFFDKIYIEKYPDTVEAICSSGDYELTVTETLGRAYPADVKLNVLVADGFAVGRRASASDDVVSYIESTGRRFINVSQGYAACSCLAYKGLIITADRGIAKALSGVCDTLVIASGGISLPPYGTGFIGGASGVDGDTVYFTGDIMTHPDGARITDALTSRGAKCVSLCDGGLFDVGGIKFIEH